MKLLFENWRTYLQFPKVIEFYEREPVSIQKIKDELLLVGADTGIIMWGRDFENFKWYDVKFNTSALPKTKPSEPQHQ